MQRCRDKRAATKFFRGLLKGFLDVPHVIVIDKRQRYATQRELLPGVAPHWHDFNNYTETCTSQSGNTSAAGKDLIRPRSTLNDSSPPMVLSPNISVHVGIGFPCPHIVKSYELDLRSDRRSRLQPWLPEGVKK